PSVLLSASDERLRCVSDAPSCRLAALARRIPLFRFHSCNPHTRNVAGCEKRMAYDCRLRSEPEAAHDCEHPRQTCCRSTNRAFQPCARKPALYPRRYSTTANSLRALSCRPSEACQRDSRHTGTAHPFRFGCTVDHGSFCPCNPQTLRRFHRSGDESRFCRL